MENSVLLLWFFSVLFLPIIPVIIAFCWKGYVKHSVLVAITILLLLLFIGGNIWWTSLFEEDLTFNCIVQCIWAILMTGLYFNTMHPHTLLHTTAYKMVVEEVGYFRIETNCVKRYIIGTVKYHLQSCNVCLLEDVTESSKPQYLSKTPLRKFEIPAEVVDDKWLDKMGLSLNAPEKEDFLHGKLALPVKIINYDYKIIKCPIACLS